MKTNEDCPQFPPINLRPQMVDQARMVLDRLLGAERNAAMAKNPCYHHSLGLCPKLLLVNTKYSIGTCELDHIYVKLPPKKMRYYELDLLRTLLNVCRRASRTITTQIVLNRGGSKKFDLARSLSTEISVLISSFPSLPGIMDSVEEIEMKNKALDNIREELFANNKELPINKCDICYEHLSLGLSSQKYEKHTRCKIHRVFATIRNKIGELASKYDILKYSDLVALNREHSQL